MKFFVLYTKKTKSPAKIGSINTFLKILILFFRKEHKQWHFIPKLCTCVENLYKYVSNFFSNF